MDTPPTSPPIAEADTDFMCQALALAESAIGLTDPNPRVGCVITTADGRVIGRGHTQQVGGPHAEIMAMRDAAAHGESVRGATAYVTLEPCSHHGRTPPCCDALAAAGIGRVVVAIGDPNPLVAGRGSARLRAAGVEVLDLPPGPLQDEANDLNIGFFARMRRGRPWVRMKAAVSIDGRTALPDGTSQWITGEAARRDGHRWRRRAGAIVTGVGTVLDDDPRLDVRLVETVLQPLRVVLDSTLRTPPAARILEAPGRALVCTATVAPERRAALEARGAEVALRPDGAGRIDLAAVLADLGERGVNEVHVEAGQRLNGSFVLGGWVDELLVYVGPKLLGSGRDLAAFGPLATLSDAPGFAFHDVAKIGDDLRIMARRRA